MTLEDSRVVFTGHGKLRIYLLAKREVVSALVASLRVCPPEQLVDAASKKGGALAGPVLQGWDQAQTHT